MWTQGVCEIFRLNRTGTAGWLQGAIFLDMRNSNRHFPQGKYKTQFALTKQNAVAHKLDIEILATAR